MTRVVGIRANAGASIGFGHVRRCASLAEVLLEKGSDVVFFVNPESQPDSWLPRGGPGRSHVELVPAAEAATLELTHSRSRSLKVQALVVDSYDVRDDGLRRASVPVVAILDAPPPIVLPAILIVNGGADATSTQHLLAAGARALLGPDYVLLRKEFARQGPRVLRAALSHVLIMAGGADPTGLSVNFVDAVRDVLPDATITVVVGPYFATGVVATLLERVAIDPRIQLVRDPASVRDLMLAADLALTSGGQTTYELAATGVPSCAVRVALNQTGNLEGLGARGAILWVGDIRDADLTHRVQQGTRLLAEDARLRETLSQAGQRTVDGRGAVRVAEAILELCA